MTTRCAICGIPRADHGYTAVAGQDGTLGPWHEYQPTAAQLPPADPRRMAQLMIEATPAADRAQAHIATIRQAIRNNRQEQE